MSDPELPWKLLSKDDGVYLNHDNFEGSLMLLNLGPKEQVMEALSQFLCEQDFGEVMK